MRPEHNEIAATSKLPRGKSCSRKQAGSRPNHPLGKADDAEEEPGKCTQWDRRGMGSGISGQIRRNNVGKILAAAGAGRNLHRPLIRG